MISVSTCWRSSQIRDGARLIDAMVELGCEAVELEYRISREMLEQVRPGLELGQVQVTSVHNFFPVPDIVDADSGAGDLFLYSSDDPDERARAVKYGIVSIKEAARLGASAVVFHLSKVSMPNGMPQLKDFYDAGAIDSPEARRFRSEFATERRERAPEAFGHVLSSLDMLVAAAQQYGVTIGVENRYHPNEIPSVVEVGKILDTFDGAPIGYWHDVGHAVVQDRLGICPESELLESFGDRMIGVHIHDVVGHDDHWAPGTGEVDFAAIAPHVPSDAIRVIEAHSKVGRDELVSSLDFVREAGLG